MDTELAEQSVMHLTSKPAERADSVELSIGLIVNVEFTLLPPLCDMLLRLVNTRIDDDELDNIPSVGAVKSRVIFEITNYLRKRFIFFSSPAMLYWRYKSEIRVIASQGSL